MYTDVQCTNAYNSQDMEATYMSTDWWIDKKMWEIYV